MKKIILFTLLALVTGLKYRSCGTPPRVDRTTPGSDSPCNSELWARTYGAMSRFGRDLVPNPRDLYDRMNLDHRCVFDVKAQVESVSPQPDGDMKLWLIIDDASFMFPQAEPGFVPLRKIEFYPDGEFDSNHNKRRVVAEIVCAAPKQKRGSGIILGSDPPEAWHLPNEMSPVTDPRNDNGVIACRNYNNTVYIPQPKRTVNGQTVMEEVYVTGELITDRGPILNPAWNPKSPPSVPHDIPGHGHVEIHPVSLIRK